MKKHIVTIGGGTGQYTLLSGLKKQNVKISAIVSMADNGGSTGVLRDEYGVLPPGDVRQCLVALSREQEALRKLFSYRYATGPFKGHSFGNLFLSTMEKTTGSFAKAVKQAGKILNTYGRVIPVSTQEVNIVIKLDNGVEIFGEKFLDTPEVFNRAKVVDVKLSGKAKANKDAIKAVSDADLIVLGPGDIFGSIVPNLLFDELAEAIRKSSAKVVYVANITNKRLLTENFKLSDYVSILEKYIPIDCVLFNCATPTSSVLKKYMSQEGKGVLVGKGKMSSKNIGVIKSDLLADSDEFIRHDPDKLAQEIMKLL